MEKLARSVLRGDRKAVSKALSLVENREPGYIDLLSRIFPSTGRAFVIGITGPPGTGKSTLVTRLISSFRSRGLKTSVLAVDPSSPVTGGAILGDRVRMLEHSLDYGVYIRSMASRGEQGGLSSATKNAVRILDAAGSDLIIVETVGIGQSEVEIVGVADVVVVVLMPELGDEVQAMKAGLMEVGDIFLVNKSDLPGVDLVLRNLMSVLSTKDGKRKQVAIGASAKTGEGVERLVTKLLEYMEGRKESAAKEDSGEVIVERRRNFLENEVLDEVASKFSYDIKERLSHDETLPHLLQRVNRREIDPASAAKYLASRYRIERKGQNSKYTHREKKKGEKGVGEHEEDRFRDSR